MILVRVDNPYSVAQIFLRRSLLGSVDLGVAGRWHHGRVGWHPPLLDVALPRFGCTLRRSTGAGTRLNRVVGRRQLPGSSFLVGRRLGSDRRVAGCNEVV